MKVISRIENIEKKEDRELVELLQNLVRIPSWVPDDEKGKWTQNENKLVDYIEAWLTKNTDLKVVRQKLSYGRFNLIATKGKPETIFLAHTDTVAPPVKATYSPFGAEICDGKIWGRGTSDMKSGIAALMQAAFFSSESNNYMIMFYADEEYDFLGMKALVEEHSSLRPKYIISADGGDLCLGNGCRGLIEIRARVIGEAAHAASGKGKNSIWGVYQAVDKLGKYLIEIEHPVMGISSLNLAYVCGGKNLGLEGIGEDRLIRVGQEGNVVPDIAEFVIDVRPSSPEITAEVILNNLEETVLSLGMNLEIVTVRHNLGAWYTQKSEIEQFEEIVKRTCGTKTVRFSDLKKGGYLDIQMLWEITGRPTSLVFGAASEGTAHTDHENVEIESLLKTRDFFVEVMKGCK